MTAREMLKGLDDMASGRVLGGCGVGQLPGRFRSQKLIGAKIGKRVPNLRPVRAWKLVAVLPNTNAGLLHADCLGEPSRPAPRLDDLCRCLRHEGNVTDCNLSWQA